MESPNVNKDVRLPVLPDFSYGSVHTTLGFGSPSKMDTYHALTLLQEQEGFCVVVASYKETMRSHLAPDSMQLCICVHASIFEEIIGELLFHPADMDGLTRQRALSLFTHAGIGNYEVMIKNPKWFSLLVRTIALGASFRMATQYVQLVRNGTNMAVYKGCTDTLISSYCRVVCPSSFQLHCNFLCHTTGFSLTLDSSTLHSISYLDIRVRLVLARNMKMLHLFTLSLFGLQMNELMYAAFAKLMDVIC